MEINWQEPSPLSSGKGFSDTLREVVPILRQNPGRWALIAEDASVSITTRWKELFPDIEFTTRGLPDNRGRASIYARAKED